MLTQLATVKGRLGIALTDDADDVTLENYILAVSGRFEKETNRSFGPRAAGLLYEFSADRMEIIPQTLPVWSVTAFHLKEDETTGWEALTLADVLYLVRKVARGSIQEGHIISLKDSALGTENAIARITYTGGYVLPGTEPGEGEVALPDEIESAATEQVCYWYQNRKRLGIVSISMEGGNMTQFAKLDLLPHIVPVLKKYERSLH